MDPASFQHRSEHIGPRRPTATSIDQHRRFIEDLAAQSRLRDFVGKVGSPGLTAAFNACIEQVARFRTRHLEYAASYINKQAGSIAGNDPDVGTGGTPFMKYLKKHRDESRAAAKNGTKGKNMMTAASPKITKTGQRSPTPIASGSPVRDNAATITQPTTK